MKKIAQKFKNRLLGLRTDERGMEAAQVIMILVIVIIALVPLITNIVNGITAQGNTAATCISTKTC